MLINYEIAHKVAATIAAALAIEASIPKKPTTVSYKDKLKDLELSKFILSSTILTPTYLELIINTLKGERICLSRYIFEAIKSVVTSRLIRTNTSLGYIILTIPLAYSIGLTLRLLNKLKTKINYEDDIVFTVINLYETLTKNSFMNEELTYLCRAFKVVHPSYLSKVLGNIPDINNCEQISKHTVRDLLVSSRYLDIIMYELYHNYPLTIMTYNVLRRFDSINDLALLKTFMMLSTKLNDSICLLYTSPSPRD